MDMRPLPDGMTLAQWFELSEQESEEQICDKLYGHMFQTPVQYRSDPKGLELSWVVEGLLPETYLCVIAATSNAGKSCLITSLALAVAAGKPFLGMPTAKSAVLWVAFEESKEERYLALAAHKKIPENFFVSHEKLFIDTLGGQDALRYWIRRTKAKLVVIDSLYASCVAETLSDGRKAREVLMGLKDLCRKERCAAIVLHHVTKDASAGQTRERFADSNQILATASMDLLMDFTERADGSRRIWLRGRGRGAFAKLAGAFAYLQLAALFALGLVLLGCGRDAGVAGVYHADGSLQQIVLNTDGTYRIMYGERTSPADRQGRYTWSGDTVNLADDKPSEPGAKTIAHLAGRVLTIGSQPFTKE